MKIGRNKYKSLFSLTLSLFLFSHAPFSISTHTKYKKKSSKIISRDATLLKNEKENRLARLAVLQHQFGALRHSSLCLAPLKRHIYTTTALYSLSFSAGPLKNAVSRHCMGKKFRFKALEPKHEKYDGVVGDVTITANRSEDVGFTFPYTPSGVAMLVPVRDVRSHRAWIFLKPLTADLWLVSGAFFILTGAVVWFLEHRINPEFRGPPAHQIGTVFYFSFSTLVFAHKETIMSNLSKLVMTIWVFVVLILTSSYTASLTSMLTVRQVQPSITDIQELIVNRKNVGFLRHSFVKGLLLKIGFKESQLFGYKSPEEYKDALSNGSVAAIIDEIPYLKLFLNSFCDNFTMGNPLYKTSGFGFAFPKGSSLVSDMSRAILNLTESDEMVEIERRWFGDQSSCLNQGSSSISASNSLDFNSFYGLFLITGGASLLALLIYSLSFCYRYRHSLAAIKAEEKSLRRKLSSIATLYDEKDLSSHTFNKSGEASIDGRGRNSSGTSHRLDARAGSQSPFSFALGTETPPSSEITSPQSGTPQWMPPPAVGVHDGVELIAPARS